MHLRIFIELTHRSATTISVNFWLGGVVFLSDDELIFLLLFETMISQACKYVLRPPKPFNVSNFSFFRQLRRSFRMFVCLLGEK